MTAIAALAVPQGAAPRALRWADRGATVLLVAVLGVLALGTALRLAGITALVERSGSMRPALTAGDVVLTRATPAAALRRGQLATIADPGSGRLITHRVTGVGRAGDRVIITTRGDANDASERWALTPDAAVRRVTGRLPGAGYAVRWGTAPPVRIALAALGLGLLAAAALRRIWGGA